jgi:lipopolysaccharide biosynthesis regulator YciM
LDLQLWYLLALPLLFAAGWWARGYESGVREAGASSDAAALSRGLNLLLNDEADRAIDAFVGIARLDPGTIELHYALGNLFRRRGEFDRAIRVHAYLLGRADLPADERAQALAQLSQDYLKGGMLDRAESGFSQLLDAPRHRLDAMRALLRVRAMERDWARAIECARDLEREAGESHRVAISHYLCELSTRALAAGDSAQAGSLLEQALGARQGSVRARILLADLAERTGDRAGALRHWTLLAADAPDHFALIAERWSAALDRDGRRSEALELLRARLASNPSVDLLEACVRRVREWEGAEAAEELLRSHLRENPSILGFERLLAVRAEHSAGDGVLESLRGLLAGHARRVGRYRCGQCGFRVRAFAWQCPGCTGWETYAPRRIEELDADEGSSLSSGLR